MVHVTHVVELEDNGVLAVASQDTKEVVDAGIKSLLVQGQAGGATGSQPSQTSSSQTQQGENQPADSKQKDGGELRSGSSQRSFGVDIGGATAGVQQLALHVDGSKDRSTESGSKPKQHVPSSGANPGVQSNSNPPAPPKIVANKRAPIVKVYEWGLNKCSLVKTKTTVQDQYHRLCCLQGQLLSIGMHW